MNSRDRSLERSFSALRVHLHFSDTAERRDGDETSVSFNFILVHLASRLDEGRSFETCLCPFVVRCGLHVSERATGSWPEVSVMSPCRGNLL